MDVAKGLSIRVRDKVNALLPARGWLEAGNKATTEEEEHQTAQKIERKAELSTGTLQGTGQVIRNEKIKAINSKTLHYSRWFRSQIVFPLLQKVYSTGQSLYLLAPSLSLIQGLKSRKNGVPIYGKFDACVMMVY